MGISRSATPNGWNGPDVEMFQTGPQEFSIYAELVSGELKFDSTKIKKIILEIMVMMNSRIRGANIHSAETYFIVMDLGSGTYTISPFSSDKEECFIRWTKSRN